MNIPAEIFKAYDIRGIVDETITDEVTYKIGQAIGSEIIAAGKNSIMAYKRQACLSLILV